MLETFTAGLQAALQTSVTTALQTVLHEQHRLRDAQGENLPNRQQQRAAQKDASDEDEMIGNVFADQGNEQGGRRDGHRHGRNNERGVEHDQRPHQANRWESSFRSEIPEFHGTLNPEDFIDWINMVEEILEFRQVPDDARVSLVATRFKERSMA